MFQEYEHYVATKLSIDSKITNLKANLEQAQSDRNQAEVSYKKMMIDDAAGITSYSDEQLTKAKLDIDKLVAKIEVAEDQLQQLSEERPALLMRLYTEVISGKAREVQALNLEVERIFASARELRAKLTLEIQKGHEIYERSVELRKALNSVESDIGITGFNQTSTIGIPEKPPIKQAYAMGTAFIISDEGVLPSEEELEKAYQLGTLPPWVEHYDKTGELLTNKEVSSLNNPTPPAEPAKQKSKIKEIFDRYTTRIPIHKRAGGDKLPIHIKHIDD